MNIPKQLTTVTKLSKTVALAMFVALPFIGFLFGIKYQEQLNHINSKVVTVNMPSDTPTIPNIPVKSSIPSPTTIPTGWKTYENVACNYSLSYPPEWVIKENCGISENATDVDCIQTKDYDGGYGVTIDHPAKGHLITMFCRNNQQSETQNLMNDCLRDNITAAQKNLGTTNICNSISFGGYYFVTRGNDAYSMYHNQTLYQFNIEKTIETSKAYGSVIEMQILDTFRLIK